MTLYRETIATVSGLTEAPFSARSATTRASRLGFSSFHRHHSSSPPSSSLVANIRKEQTTFLSSLLLYRSRGGDDFLTTPITRPELRCERRLCIFSPRKLVFSDLFRIVLLLLIYRLLVHGRFHIDSDGVAGGDSVGYGP